jgi:hypothetical protein
MSYKIIDRDELSETLAHEKLRLWKQNDFVILEVISEGNTGHDQMSDDEMLYDMQYYLADETIQDLVDTGIIKEERDDEI